MVLIAKGRDGEIDLRHAILLRLGFRVFDGPARVAVLLSELRGLVLPVLGDATVTERLLLLLCVALLRRRDDRGIDNLAAHRQETRRPSNSNALASPPRMGEWLFVSGVHQRPGFAVFLRRGRRARRENAAGTVRRRPPSKSILAATCFAAATSCRAAISIRGKLGV